MRSLRILPLDMGYTESDLAEWRKAAEKVLQGLAQDTRDAQKVLAKHRWPAA